MSDFADHFEEDSLEFGDHVGEDGYDFTPKQYAAGIEKVSESCISHWSPQVDAVFKPAQGTVFDSIDVAYEFYAQYAQQGGFEVRKSTQTPVRRQRVIDGQRTVKVKYFACSREGFKPNKERAKPVVSNDQSSKTNISGVSNGDGNNTEDVACENNSESSNKKQKQ